MEEILAPSIIEAVHLGPTWEPNPDWDGASEATRYILPARTLGWQALAWSEANLQGEEFDDDGNRLPFTPTREQARFVLWWYAVDEHGTFIYRNAILQRLKGWG